jgi:hypothetical protein
MFVGDLDREVSSLHGARVQRNVGASLVPKIVSSHQKKAATAYIACTAQSVKTALGWINLRSCQLTDYYQFVFL